MGSDPSWPEIVSAVAAVTAALVLIPTYYRDVSHKRTDWLYRIYEKFYEDGTYKNTRRTLDNPSGADFAKLRTAIETNQDTPEVENLIDYLNFFELLCYLVAKRRISKADIRGLFDYWLDNLARHTFVRVACGQGGFEYLTKELNRRAGKL